MKNLQPSLTNPEPGDSCRAFSLLVSRMREKLEKAYREHPEEMNKPDPKPYEKPNDLTQMVMWFSSDEARVLWVRPNKSGYPSDKFSERLVDGQKQDLPLFNGFTRLGGDKATEAIITLDVDNKEDAQELEAKFDTLQDTRMFKSYSASGKCKVHMVVGIVKENGEFHRFSAVLAAKCMCTLLGVDCKKIDQQGVSRCFVNRSFMEAVESGVKTVVDFEELLGEAKTIWASQPTSPLKGAPYTSIPIRPYTQIPEDSLKTLATETVKSLSLPKMAIEGTSKVLALMMCMSPDEEGNRFLSQHSAATNLGLSQPAVCAAMNRLAKAGVIEYTIEATFNRSRRWKFTPSFSHLSQGGSVSADSQERGRVESKAVALQEEGIAVEGNFNEAEKKIVGSAITSGMDFEALCAIVQRVWVGWYRVDRRKRLLSTFNGILKKELRNGEKAQKTAVSCDTV